MLSNIEIIVSWGAVGTFASIIVAGLSMWGFIYWKLAGHMEDNRRHLTGGYVSVEVCQVTKEAIKEELCETRQYIGSVESRSVKALGETKQDIIKKIDDLMAILR
jgi:esterase/lipase